jgi:hypothetical protein
LFGATYARADGVAGFVLGASPAQGLAVAPAGIRIVVTSDAKRRRYGTQEGIDDKDQSQESGSTSEENRRICREKLLPFAAVFGPTKISHSTR